MRGINRQSIFEDEEDRQKLIDTIARYKEISCYRVFAYCLMDNHIHMLIQESKEPIDLIMKRISSSYVLWYNRKYERCGHLFQERYKSEIVDNNNYFLIVLRYIHQNPVKAKIVSDLLEFKWSSYREYKGKGHIIAKEYVLEMFSKEPSEAKKQFEKFLRENNSDKCLELEESQANISDEKVREIIKDRYSITAISLSVEPREKQDAALKELKLLNGVSIR